ncbi:MAG: hypothetical protein KGV57_02140 [Fusobacterium sp.]|nr:hypothetical protein [Fusobacterium sp.]
MKWLGFKLSVLIVFMLSITALIGYINVRSLREAGNSQKILKAKTELLEKKRKDLDVKNIAYDEKFDLQKIRKNMERKGMTIADEVVFFELGD